MTGLVVHQCPKCELRFSFRSEMEHHLHVDHPVPTHVDKAPAVTVAETRAPAAPPAVSPIAVPRPGAWLSRARLTVSLFAIASVLLVAYAAVFASTLTAVVVAALVLVVSGIYLRRSRGRARLPHR